MLVTRKTFTSCEELPLYNYIKIVVTGNLDYLYSEAKKPWHLSAKLNQIWEEIFTEYSSLTGDSKSIHVFSLIRDITYMNNKLSVIRASVTYLSKSYDERLCTMLRAMGFMFAYTNDESLLKDLKLTISSAKSIIMEKQELEREIDTLTANSKPPTEKDYNDLIAQLSKFMAFKINTKTTTLIEFISYIEAYNNENKAKQNG